MQQRNFLTKRLKYTRGLLEHELQDAPSDKQLYKGWTIRQLMAHLAGWDDSIIEALNAHSAGEPIDQTVARGVDIYNEQTVNSRETLDLKHTKQEFDKTRQTVYDVLRDLPDEKFNEALTFPWGEVGTVAYFIEIFLDYEEEHAEHPVRAASPTGRDGVRRWKLNPDQTIEH